MHNINKAASALEQLSRALQVVFILGAEAANWGLFLRRAAHIKHKIKICARQPRSPLSNFIFLDMLQKVLLLD